MKQALAFIVLLASIASAPAFCRDAKYDSLGQEVVKTVRDNFYDPEAGTAWAAAHDHYGRGALDREGFIRRTREALAELKVSHTAYYTPADPQYFGLLSIFREVLEVRSAEVESIGADVTGEGFVRFVFAGGPAEAAGLRRGDRILEADGRPFQPVGSFKGRAGRSVSLKVQQSKHAVPQVLHAIPRKIDPGREWLDAQIKGSKVIERKGVGVAYVPLFSCAGEQYLEGLQEALGGTLREGRALVLDFRDGWGGCNPDFVNLFNGAVPVLTSIGRDGKAQRIDSQWRGPVVILINQGTRSGKEVVSYALQKHGWATLVGARSAGAVMGGRSFLLSDRSLLYLAVADFRVNGRKLEGVGVKPDVEVKDELPYAGGKDPQLEKALDLASRSVGSGKRRPGSPESEAR